MRLIAAEGTTVLLTTQYLEEADRLAERMAVIDHGKVIAEGTSRDLKSSIGANSLRVRVASADHRAKAIELVTGVIGDGVFAAQEPVELTARVESPEQAARVLAALGEHRIEIAQFAVGDPSLDEVFLALTGKPSEEQKEVQP